MKRSLIALLAMLMLLTMPACAENDAATGGNIVFATAVDTTGFSDVSDGAWYADAVRFVSERGLMNGTGGGRFSPEGTFTRAQFATVLYRIAGQPAITGVDSFTDTESGVWYSDAVLWAEQNGVIKGIGGGLFGTNDPTTQEQLVTMLWRMAGEPDADAASDASAYAAKAVGWARAYGIAPATADYTFKPKGNATRVQVAVILKGYLLREEETVMSNISLTIGSQAVPVTWEDNASVDALRELLHSGPLTVEMSMYGGFEQVGPLGTSLPRNDRQTTTSAGDIVLYSGNQIVIFYGSNSWAYTRLGHVNLSAAEMADLLSHGDVNITLSIE